MCASKPLQFSVWLIWLLYCNAYWEFGSNSYYSFPHALHNTPLHIWLTKLGCLPNNPLAWEIKVFSGKMLTGLNCWSSKHLWSHCKIVSRELRHKSICKKLLARSNWMWFDLVKNSCLHQNRQKLEAMSQFRKDRGIFFVSVP